MNKIQRKETLNSPSREIKWLIYPQYKTNIFNISPQTHNIAARSIENLPNKKWNREVECDFVNKSALCMVEVTKGNDIVQDDNEINLIMFGLLMEYWIAHNLNSTLIVRIQWNRLAEKYTYIFKQPT